MPIDFTATGNATPTFSGGRINWGNASQEIAQSRARAQAATVGLQNEKLKLQQQQAAKGIKNPSQLVNLQAQLQQKQITPQQFSQQFASASKGADGAGGPTTPFKATPINFAKALPGQAANIGTGFAKGLTQSEKTAATGIARVLPGGTADIKAQQQATAQSNADAQKILQLQKAGKISRTGAQNILGANAANASNASSDLSNTVKTMPTKGQLAAGFAGTAADILTLGTLPEAKGAGALAKTARAITTPAAVAATSAANAGAGGGTKKQIVENALSGAAFPLGLKGLGKGIEAAQVGFGKDQGVNDLLRNSRVQSVAKLGQGRDEAAAIPTTADANTLRTNPSPAPAEVAPKTPPTPVEVPAGGVAGESGGETVKPTTTKLNEAGGVPIGNAADLIDKHQQSVKFSGDIQRFAASSEGAKGNLLNDSAKLIKNRTQLSNDEKTQLQALRDARATSQTLPQVSDKVAQADKEATAFAKATTANDVERAKLEGNLQKAEKLQERNPETYTHRVAQGKGSSFDYVLQNDRKSPLSVNFGKTTPADKTRVYHALTDEQGNRQIVAIKNRVFKNEAGRKVSQGKLVTAIGKDGELKDMGLLNKAPVKKVDEFYDKNVREALNKTAQNLGIKVEKTTSRRGNYAGKSINGQKQIVLKAGAPSRTMLHEIGHQLDEKYDLQKMFVNNKNFKQELRSLTDLRHEGQTTTNSFKQYVRKGEEKIASMFETYLHAPERFKETAPKSFATFEKFLKSHPETKPITDYKPSMVLGKETVTSGPEQLPGEFIDKSGKTYKVGDATTAEIEKVGNTQYYKDPALTNHAAYLDSRIALENARMFDAIKKAPEAKAFMVEPGETAPKGYKPAPGMPQFTGYKFEPRVAEAITDVFGAREPAVLNKASKALRQTIVYFPLKHDFNMAAAYAMDRGLSGLSPTSYPRLFKSWGQAFNDIRTKSDFYQQVANKGFGLTTNDKAAFEKTFKGELQKLRPDTVQAIAKLSNLNPARLYTALQRLTVWDVQDFLNLARIHERTAPKAFGLIKGQPLDKAIQETEKHSFQYKVPSRVVGSRTASKALRSPVIFFGAYKYDQFKMVANAVKGMVNVAHPVSAAKDIDRVAALAVGALLLWPKVNKLIQNLTGDPNAHMTAPGPLGIPESINKVRTGQQTGGQAVGNQVSIGPIQQVLNIKNNTDSFTGKKIADPNTTESQQMGQRGKYLLNQLAPVQKASGTQNAGPGKKVAGTLLSLAGATLPKNSPQVTKLNSLKYDSLPNAQSQAKALAAKGDFNGANKAIQQYDDEVRKAVQAYAKSTGKPMPSDASLRKGGFLYQPKQSTIHSWASGKKKSVKGAFKP